MDVPAQTDVVENGHPFEKLDLLKGTGDAQLRALVRSKAGNFFSFEKNFPLLGLIKTIDTIQANRLAGPVWTDEGKDLPLLHFQADSPEGLHAAEGNINVLDL